MDEQLRSNLTSSKHWVRFLYMILFAFFLYIASFLMVVLVIVQFAFALLSGAENAKLRVLGHELTTYINQTLLFLTYNSDFKPFPFADWPTAPVKLETRTVTVDESGTSTGSQPDIDPYTVAGSSPIVPPVPGGSPAGSGNTFGTGETAVPSSTRPAASTTLTSPLEDPAAAKLAGAEPSGTDGGVAKAGEGVHAGDHSSEYFEAEPLDETLETDARFGQTGVTGNDYIVRDDEPGDRDAVSPHGSEDGQPVSPDSGRNRRT